MGNASRGSPYVPDFLPVPGLAGASPCPLLGREHEVADILRLLDSDIHRVVSLLGPGGVGKTRLAEEIARTIAPSFAHGATFIRLDPVRDAGVLTQAVVAGLGLQTHGDMTPGELLDQVLAHRHMLLVLDNVEQIVEEASRWVAHLLSSAPRIRILVTSRIPLRISCEQQFLVQPLETTDDASSPGAALTLFAQRAAAIDPAFVLDEVTMPVVTHICEQLDGLPLAIELAAARTKVLSPKALLARLTDRLTVLSGGLRDAPQRLRSMRDAIGWSYELLSPEEQRLFRRLSVFLGGFTLEAAEFVTTWPHTAHPEPAGIDLLQSLVDQSLVQVFRDGGNVRYRMLETIREYGLEQLQKNAEDEALAAHASYIIDLAHRAERELIGPDQAAWLDLLEAAYADIRAAASWLERNDQLDDAIGIYAHIAGFLDIRGHVVETLPVLEKWLKRTELAEQTHARALLLSTVSRFIHNTGSFERGTILLEEAVAIFRGEGDLWHAAINSAYLGIMYGFTDDIAKARDVLEETVSLATTIGHHRALGASLRMLSEEAWLDGDDTGFRTMLDRALQISEEHGDWWLLTFCLQNQATDAMAQGHWDDARRIVLESMRIRTELRGKQELPADWWALSTIAQAQGDERAEEYLLTGMKIAEETGHSWYTTLLQFKLGVLALDQGDLPQASRILQKHVRSFHTNQRVDMLALTTAAYAVMAEKAGDAPVAAQFLGASIGLDPTAHEQRIDLNFHIDTSACEATLVSTLGREAFTQAYEAGAAWSADEAIAAILAYNPPVTVAGPMSAGKQEPSGPNLAQLSRREIEVLQHMANGLSNQQIADAMFLSFRTVTTHVSSIMGKLDAPSRTAAVAWAIRNGIA